MAKGLGIKVPDVTTAAQVYEQALAHVPMKLINQAISRIWRTWKRASLPLPADLLETIKVELAYGEAKPREDHRKPSTAKPYTGAYEGWEFLSDDEKYKRIALDVADIEAAGDPHGLVGMGKAFLEKAGWNTA